MKIEQKQNRIYKPQSVYTYAAEECNQVSTELDNLITEGGLTPSAGDLTQVKTAVNNIVGTAANNLQEQIDAITSASDVYDVVGTYADLQAYDTTDVPLNDIIKVLQDNTHNDAATYYRLVEVSGNKVWQYVGQEGPYYTKSEIDTDFALKSELPTIATTSQVGLIKPDNQSTFVGNDGTLTISSNVAAALPLFTFVWADHLLNDSSYLRADTFSWQSGSVYTNAYNHLVNDIAGVTASTETIGSYTITYYQANDGHKVVLADQETTVQNIFNESGVAWYYILDTANVRFKLPRINPAEKELLKSVSVVGNGINGLGFYDGTNSFTLTRQMGQNGIATNTLGATIGSTASTGTSQVNKVFGVTPDPTKSAVLADFDNKETIFSGNKYLYFYIGNFSQSATEQTAGLNLELFNNKMDADGGNSTVRFATYAELQEVKRLMLRKLDYNNAVEVTVPTSNTPLSYIVPNDGYITSIKLANVAGYLLINGITQIGVINQNAFANPFIPVNKNDIITKGANYGGSFVFVPEKQDEESA